MTPSPTLLPDNLDPSQLFVVVQYFGEPQERYVTPLSTVGGNVSLAAASLPATTETSGSYYTGANAGATITPSTPPMSAISRLSTSS